MKYLILKSDSFSDTTLQYFLECISKKQPYFNKELFKELELENPNSYIEFSFFLLKIPLKYNIPTASLQSNIQIYLNNNYINKLESLLIDKSLTKDLSTYLVLLINKNNIKKIVIYGAGKIFENIEQKLNKTNIKILHIIDKKAEDKEFNFKGYKVKPKNSLLKLNANIPIVIASFAFADEIVKELENYKKENGLKNEIYDLHRCLNY